MFWEEKIEQMKSIFPATDFKIPFIDGTNILKAIEQHFIVYKDVAGDLNNLVQYHSHWAENIKLRTKVLSGNVTHILGWLERLEEQTNYWVVLTLQNSAGLKHQVFDCRRSAIYPLLEISRCNFFIIDKKYRWLAYFDIEQATDLVTCYKSGKKRTPFEADVVVDE